MELAGVMPLSDGAMHSPHDGIPTNAHDIFHPTELMLRKASDMHESLRNHPKLAMFGCGRIAGYSRIRFVTVHAPHVTGIAICLSMAEPTSLENNYVLLFGTTSEPGDAAMNRYMSRKRNIGEWT
jgi:hypothetical protein